MYVDDDPSGTLSDVSPISEYDSGVPNLPLETSPCDNTQSDIKSGPRDDNDIKFNEITANGDENTDSNTESNHQQNGQTGLVHFQLGPNSKCSVRKDLIRRHQRVSKPCRNFESLILIPAI